MKLFLIILMISILSVLFIISNNNLAIQNLENIQKFNKLFVDWANQSFINLKTTTEEVISLNLNP